MTEKEVKNNENVCEKKPCDESRFFRPPTEMEMIQWKIREDILKRPSKPWNPENGCINTIEKFNEERDLESFLEVLTKEETKNYLAERETLKEYESKSSISKTSLRSSSIAKWNFVRSYEQAIISKYNKIASDRISREVLRKEINFHNGVLPFEKLDLLDMQVEKQINEFLDTLDLSQMQGYLNLLGKLFGPLVRNDVKKE